MIRRIVVRSMSEVATKQREYMLKKMNTRNWYIDVVQIDT